MAQPPGEPATGPGLVASIGRYAVPIAIAAIVCGLLGFWLSSLQAVRYEAESGVILRDPNDARLFSDSPTYADAERYVNQQAALAGSRSVFAEAADMSDVDVDTFEDAVEVVPEVSSNRLSFIATAPTAEAAAERANSMVAAFEQIARRQRLDDVGVGSSVVQEQISALRETVDQLSRQVENNPQDAVAADRLRSTEVQLLALESRVSELSADAAMFGSGVQLQERAQVPDEPLAPKPVRNGALGAVLAVMVGCAVAYWRAGLAPRAEGRGDAGATLAAPLLGDIPRFDHAEGVPEGVIPSTAASEAYRFVLSSIDFSLDEIGGSSIMVTSAEARDGKTSTALHLAVAAARTDRSVLLVDADVRKHGLTSELRAQNHRGLVEYADSQGDLDDFIRRYRLTTDVQLSVVPSGEASPDSIGLMRTPRFKKAMQEIRQRAEFVVVDSPPLLAVADAAELAAQVDAIVLVVNSDAELEQLQRVRSRLAFVPTPLIGYVYNRGAVRPGASL